MKIWEKGETVFCLKCKEPLLRIKKDIHNGDAVTASVIEGIGNAIKNGDKMECWHCGVDYSAAMMRRTYSS